MAVEPQNPAQVECRTVEGRLSAQIHLGRRGDVTGWSVRLILGPLAGRGGPGAGEEPVQLRERCRYAYRLEPVAGEHPGFGAARTTWHQSQPRG